MSTKTLENVCGGVIPGVVPGLFMIEKARKQAHNSVLLNMDVIYTHDPGLGLDPRLAGAD